ncbi:xylulokinase [Paenisporosarcina antarctica]|uniref:Xylulose kinase n=1 Tax=Paenisporosarcina antarctica TaxID=417367 RepID=A0A4P7A182_9BACL|nr:xylulokinase [Paenisporosarcina antarctica]QBP42651.1 xylulokinase [Paenisporosarcina antarctica]
MKYVIGIDLGTSAVKAILVDQSGEVVAEVSHPYPLIQKSAGYSEQNPEEWVKQTAKALAELVSIFTGDSSDIEGISYSGQMHGLVLLNENFQVLRPAILWNDTRTSQQCERITEEFGEEILAISKNLVLEGFTLPKILWVQEHEPDLFKQAAVFLLPKDYVRYWMTGMIHSEYSDAAGTLLLDVVNKEWNSEILRKFSIPETICPPLVESHALVGTVRPEVASELGLSVQTKVFAGGADNACGAIGAGILSSKDTLCSIGTSGVILSYESDKETDYQGNVHFFNHGKVNSFYSMGVTLSAGQSLTWFKNTFAQNETFEQMIDAIYDVPVGSEGLLFTPYLFGERTPHPDSLIRGSFIGISGSHRQEHFVRAVLEGITFSLNETIQLFRQAGKNVDTIISIGGGAKSDSWLQIQADIFNAKVIKLKSEQGPGLGAAMLAAYGVGWFSSLEECAKKFIQYSSEFHPHKDRVEKYQQLFEIYQMVYSKTKEINHKLAQFRS